MKLIPSRFRRETAGAVTGLSLATAMGQAIAFVAIAVLAHFVTPAGFAIYGVYTACFSWLASVVCLRYEQAIVLPADDEDGERVFLLALLAAVGVSLLALAVVLTFGSPLSRALGVPGLRASLTLIPVALLATGAAVSLNYLALRRKLYGPIMRSRVFQGVGTAVGQLTFAAAGLGGGGLVVGDVVGRVSAVIPLARRSGVVAVAARSSVSSLRRAARRYRRFPLISAPSSLINSAGLVAPVFMLTALYGPRVGGLYTIALRMVGGPMDLISTSVAQVYVSQFGGMVRSGDPAAMRKLFRAYTVRLLKFGTVPVILLAALAPWAFGLVLGVRWYEAGVLTRVLTPFFLSYFVVNPLSQTINLLERQDLQLFWDIGRLIGVAATIAICHELGWSAVGTVAALSLTLSTFYVILAVVGYKTLEQRTGRELSATAQEIGT